MSATPTYAEPLREYLLRHPNTPAHFTTIAKAIGVEDEQQVNALNSYLALRARGVPGALPFRDDAVLLDIVRTGRGTYAYQPGVGRTRPVAKATDPKQQPQVKVTCAIERGDLLEIGHISQNGVLVLLGSNGCTYVGTIREVQV